MNLALNEFRDGMKALLQEVTPRNGVAVVLYRHPFGVYYPLAINISKRLPTSDIDPLKLYYLFSTQILPTDFTREQIEIPATSTADVLVPHGKLGLFLFEQQDLRVRFRVHGHDDDKQVVLAILEPLNAASSTPTDSLLRATAHLARGWTKVAEQLIEAQGSTPEQVIGSVRRILDDVDPDPPFFPLLHAHVEAIAVASNPNELACGSNPLSYNCALWSLCAKLRSSFIDTMFERAQTDTCFVHPIPDTADPLPRAVSEVCDDLVYKLAVAPSGATLCARFNVPRHLTKQAREQLMQRGADVPEEASDWNLVKRGINKLTSGDPFSALVTMWVGQVANGNVTYAMPVGFALGAQQHALAEIAGRSTLESRKDRVESKNGTVGVSFVWQEEQPATHWIATKERIRALANNAERRLDGIVNRFRPPYVLDFQGDKEKKSGLPQPLLIRCADKSVDPIEIPEADPAYAFYLLLARARDHGDGLVTHNMLRDHVFNDKNLTTNKVSRKVDDRMRKMLRDIGIGDNRDDLLENKKGKGWKLGSAVTVDGLTRDALERITQRFEEWMTRRNTP